MVVCTGCKVRIHGVLGLGVIVWPADKGYLPVPRYL
jgi:hypothetical protein